MSFLTGIPSLLPYKNYLSTFNTCITVFLNLSPVVVFLNVAKGKEKYTNIPPMMLLFNFLNNAIWGCYWHRKGELAGFLCSFICGTIATIFLVWWLYYKAEKAIDFSHYEMNMELFARQFEDAGEMEEAVRIRKKMMIKTKNQKLMLKKMMLMSK